MTDQFCKRMQVLLLQLLESQNTALFSLSVLHLVFCPVATLGNALAIRALWKASSLPPNVRKLLLSLAFCDLAVGLFAHPTFAAVSVISAALKLNVQCQPILTISFFVMLCVAWASFVNVTAIAVDRLLIVSLHLRYAELVTSKRVTIILVAIWLISCVFSLASLMKYDFFVILTILGSSGFLLTTFACRLRLHSGEISSESNSSSIPTAKCASNCAPPRTKVCLECSVHLHCVCRLLSPKTLLNVCRSNNRKPIGPHTVCIIFRFFQFLRKSFGLLLAIKRGSQNYERHFEEILSS